MNKEKYKSILEEEKSLVEEELKGLGRFNDKTNQWEAVPEEGAVGGEADENDLADKAEDYEEKSSTMRVLVGRLNDIDEALDKIQNQKYGICEVCGSEIEEARLDVNPAARTCEACMEKVV